MSEYNSMHENATNTHKASLKQVLEKLFGDEQLKRNEHIQYIVDLLAFYSTDKYLNGLSLDLLNFDISPNPNIVKPSSLIASRKKSVSDTPITFYINSIAQLPESEENAVIWNILIIKAAIYLIALPEIKPELFKEDHSEHFNTVKRLFQRFRAAN